MKTRNRNQIVALVPFDINSVKFSSIMLRTGSSQNDTANADAVIATMTVAFLYE